MSARRIFKSAFSRLAFNRRAQQDWNTKVSQDEQVDLCTTVVDEVSVKASRQGRVGRGKASRADDAGRSNLPQ